MIRVACEVVLLLLMSVGVQRSTLSASLNELLLKIQLQCYSVAAYIFFLISTKAKKSPWFLDNPVIRMKFTICVTEKEYFM